MDRIYQVNLKLLNNKAKKAEVENKKLIQRLKKIKPQNLDKTIHQLHYDIFKIEECIYCANCCKSISPAIYDKDIERISKVLKMKPSAIVEKYLIIDKGSGYVFKKSPCPFLDENNYCQVYENRPKACKEYPHTNRKRMYQILDLSLKNTFICPAVYRIFEELKKTEKKI